MVKVDVEDGDARRSRVAEVLRRDCRFIQETVTAEQVACRVMSRRPA